MKKMYYWISTGIGNFVMMTPGMRSCHQLGYSITAGINPGWSRTLPLESAIKGCPFIDHIHRYPNPIKLSDYDSIVLFDHQEQNPFTKELRSFSQSIRVPIPDWRTSGIHEVEFGMTPARVLGHKGSAPPMLFPVEEDMFLPKVPRISIAFSCLDDDRRWRKKRWPTSKWGELIDYLGRYYPGVEICILAGPGEEPEKNRILSRVEYNNVVDYVGSTSITESAKIIKESNLIISVDNGLSHIAAAVGTQVVALYGPTLVSKNRPYTDRLSLVSSEMMCSPCFKTNKFRDCQEAKCMDNISIGDVFNEVRKSGKL